MGTAAYMSPEQARGRAVDEGTDVWAFGCVLYELLTRRRAFLGDDTASTFAAILHAEPDWSLVPHECPATVRAFLVRCLSKDPADRIRHIGDVRLALEGRLEADAANPAGTASARRRHRTLRWKAMLAVTAAAVAFLAVAGGWIAGAARPADTPRTYVLHAPHGTSFGDATMEPYPVASPDGRYVAYRTDDQSGAAVWVQRLGELAGRPLPGTQRLGVPFWSPDGTFIGIGGLKGLHTISASGEGPPQRLCACPHVGRAAWSRDGTILFADASGLSRIPARGGAVTRVTTLVAERGDFEHQHPLFLPDGRRFLFLVKSTQRDRTGVYLASLDDPASATRLLQDSSNVDIGEGPDGRSYLFFVREVMLLAQPFDLARGVLVDSPVVIAPRVVPGEAGRLAPFAAGRRALVFRQTAPPLNRLRWFDRHGVPERAGFDRSGSFRHLQLSPDGRWLAMSQFDADTAKPDVWIYDLERGVSERLTTDSVGAYFPLWTPDAKRIIYASAREGPWHLFWRASTHPGAGRTYAALRPLTKYPTDVSRDGRSLVFNGDGAVWRLPLAPVEEPVQVVSGFQGRISPDGRWLAYTSTENGRREVYVTTFPMPSERVRISIDGGEDPRWRDDGRELFYLDVDQTLVAAEVRPAPRFEVVGQRPLFRTAIDSRSLRFGGSYVPDRGGQRFLLNERVSGDEVVLTVMENWTAGGR